MDTLQNEKSMLYERLREMYRKDRVPKTNNPSTPKEHALHEEFYDLVAQAIQVSTKGFIPHTNPKLFNEQTPKYLPYFDAEKKMYKTFR